MSKRCVKLAELVVHSQPGILYECHQEEIHSIKEKALMFVDESCIIQELSVDNLTFEPMLTINAHMTDEEYALYLLSV